MFDSTDVNRDLLPHYPSSIQGELRIILQVKDEFLLCFKHLETLRNLWDQQHRIITKEFIIEQIRSGESEIEQLESELHRQKEFLETRERHNDALIAELISRGETIVANSSSRRVKSCRAALFRSCNINFNDAAYNVKDSTFLTVLENIANRIDAAQIELKGNLRPLLEFYKDLFYLQLHFTLALTQISCYCMPLMTDSISLIDRLFFWTERPEFELIKKSGQICDRLRDIYTRLQRILGRLLDSVVFLQDRIDLQRLLEIKFYDKMRQLNQLKDELLEETHTARLNLDLYEEENDRLVGTLMKIDPTFVEREAFKIYAEHKNVSSIINPVGSLNAKKPADIKGKEVLYDLKDIKNFNPKRQNRSLSIQRNSVSAVTDAFTSNDNVNNTFNVSNVYHWTENVLDSTNSFTNEKINQWRDNAFHLLDQMRKSHSKSESNICQFSDLNVISEQPILISGKKSKSSSKYMIQFSDDSKSASDHNQTTDALVLTSEILPKDD